MEMSDGDLFVVVEGVIIIPERAMSNLLRKVLELGTGRLQ